MPQRVSKILIEAVLLLSPPRSVPPVPFVTHFTVQGPWNVTQDPALLCGHMETFSERSEATPAPEPHLDGMAEKRQCLISREELSNSHLLPRKGKRICYIPQSRVKTHGGHWAWVKECQRGNNNFMKVT